MIKQVLLNISGQVQGVGFRYSALRQAKILGLTGYVKNLSDGSLEVVAVGPESDLKDFIKWCYNGVGHAVVQAIKESWSEAASDFSDFIIKY